MADLEEAFHLASSKFKICELNAYQKLAIRKIVVEKEDLFVNLPTGSVSFGGALRDIPKNGCEGDYLHFGE